MAMVPVINEVNRLQTGSPVPIGGSEQARAPFEAQEQLGRAIFDLGNALDNFKDDPEQFKIQARIAADQYEIEMLKAAQQERVVGKMDDPTGINSSQRIVDAVKPFREQLRQNIDPRASLYFEEYTGDVDRKLYPQFLDTAVKGNDQKLKADLDKAFFQIGEKAKLNPDALDTYLMEIELLAEESAQIPASAKGAFIQEKQTAAIKGLIDDFTQQGIAGDINGFSRARALLNRYAPAFDPKKTAEYKKELIDEEHKTIGRVRGDITWNQSQLDYQEKKTQADNFRTLADKFVQAKTPKDVLMAEKEGTDLLRSGKITQEQYKEAKGVRTQVMETVDDLFESSIINDIIKEKGQVTYGVGAKNKTAVERINEAYNKKGGISADRHSKLLKFAQNMREGISRDRYTEMTNYMAILDAYTKESLTAIGEDNKEAQKQLVARARAYKATFVTNVVNNPNASVPALYEKIAKELDPSLSAKTLRDTNIPGLTEVQKSNTTGIDMMMPSLEKNVKDAVKSGNPQKIKQAVDAYKKAQEARKVK